MSARLEAIVNSMAIKPNDRILEIGCGHGVAATMICERIDDGFYVGIDRSRKMIDAAARRNERFVAAGRGEFRVADFTAFDPKGSKFDKILAVRVGLFHREPERARRIVTPWLKRAGRLIVVFDEP